MPEACREPFVRGLLRLLRPVPASLRTVEQRGLCRAACRRPFPRTGPARATSPASCAHLHPRRRTLASLRGATLGFCGRVCRPLACRSPCARVDLLERERESATLDAALAATRAGS